MPIATLFMLRLAAALIHGIVASRFFTLKVPLFRTVLTFAFPEIGIPVGVASIFTSRMWKRRRERKAAERQEELAEEIRAKRQGGSSGNGRTASREQSKDFLSEIHDRRLGYNAALEDVRECMKAVEEADTPLGKAYHQRRLDKANDRLEKQAGILARIYKEIPPEVLEQFRRDGPGPGGDVDEVKRKPDRFRDFFGKEPEVGRSRGRKM